MTVVVCQDLALPPELIRINIPQFGPLETARQSLTDLPDPSYYIMRLQDVAAAALAPLRRILEIVETFAAMINCFQAVIDALLPPSPGPLIKCLKDLLAAFARLLAYIPPFAYVQTMLDLFEYAIYVVDSVFALFVLLDQKISRLKDVLADALELGDIELANITDCASQEAQALTINLMDLLKFITPLITVIVTPLARIMPIPALGDLLKQLANIPQVLTDIQTQIENTSGVPVLDPLIQALSVLRGICVQFYNVTAPFIGKSANKSNVAPPQLVNF